MGFQPIHARTGPLPDSSGGSCVKNTAPGLGHRLVTVQAPVKFRTRAASHVLGATLP